MVKQVIYLPKPVDVDVAHGTSITPLFFLFGVFVAGFVFMTGRMESESEEVSIWVQVVFGWALGRL